MKDNNNVETICLQVLSKASASVTHEIKNTLSIINENAGLIEDIHLANDQQDETVAPVDVQRAAALIVKQVQRANNIMNDLNCFAHGLDQKISSINLHTCLSLIISLTHRQAASKSITVSVTCPSDCELRTCLFPFESLLYLILCALYDLIENGSNITIKVIENQADIAIFFSSDQAANLASLIPADTSKLLLITQVKASLTCSSRSLKLTVPIVINNDQE